MLRSHRNHATAPLALAAGALLLLGPAALAGGDIGLFPVFLTDVQGAKGVVLRGIDSDSDGNYLASGELHVFYDPSLGGLALIEPSCITTSPNDYLYVGDRALRRVLALEDLDDDGTCHDAGEAVVYLSEAANLSGVGLSDVRSTFVAQLGVTWIATANTNASEIDAILRCQDGNADLDAEDAGEAAVFYAPAAGGAVGDSVPAAVVVGPDGTVYYLENGTTGAMAKGVYRLEDLNSNGAIEAPGEVFPFWIPAGGGLDLVALDVDETGALYVHDAGHERIWRLADGDLSGSIALGSEDCAWYAPGGSFASLDLTVSNDGHETLALDRSLPQGLRLLEDADDDCLVDPFAEVATAYLDTIGSEPLLDPRGIDWDFHGHEEVGKAYCFGVKDRCPCSNDGAIGTGCSNSTGNGAVLEGEGTASASLDDLEFHAQSMPNGTTAILFFSTGAQNGGLGSPFFDGLLCVQAPVVRLGARVATGGEAMWGPGLGALGGWGNGDTRYFQAWYRNTIGPCGFGSNTSNGVEIVFER